jgi:hypothetical protein
MSKNEPFTLFGIYLSITKGEKEMAVNRKDLLNIAITVVVSLFLFFFKPFSVKAEEKYSLDYTFEVNSGDILSDLHEIWYTGVYLAGRGAGNHPMFNNDAGIPHPYAMEKWEEEVGLKKIFRIDADFYNISVEYMSIVDVGDLIERVLNEGGVPIIVLETMPDSISSCPRDEDECSGRPTFPPSDYLAWEDLVYDTIKYLSAKDVLVTNPQTSRRNPLAVSATFITIFGVNLTQTVLIWEGNLAFIWDQHSFGGGLGKIFINYISRVSGQWKEQKEILDSISKLAVVIFRE